MGDADRNAILARRALFISAALAGFACTTHDEPPANKPPSEERDSSTPIVETPPADEPVKGFEGGRPAWAEVMAKAPPLDIPDGLSESEREILQSLKSQFEAKYERLGEVWALTPDCAPSDSGCKVWEQSVQAMLDAWPEGGPLCGYWVGWTGTIERRSHAHDRYLEQLRALLLADLEESRKRWSRDADRMAWVDQQTALDLGPPRPCLSCARPTLEPILISIPFASNEVALGTDLQLLQTVLEYHERNGGGARLVVRGHADPSEQNGDRLALERAEVVANWLIAAGVRKADIKVQSFGSKLLASRESADNQRVDFEVVPR